MKILVAEDDLEVAQYVGEIIQNIPGLEGANPVMVSDGDTAIDMLSSDKYDLLIFDINLPGKDGIGLMTEYRDSGRSTPAIAMSGFLDHERLAQLRNLGVHTTLFKPITPENIHSAIVSALGLA